MGSLNEIEGLADRNERIRQYHIVVAADARHHRAWNNLAVDLLAAGRWIEARRAALTVRAIDPALGSASTTCKALLAVGDYRLESELVAAPSHVVYRASGPEGAVLIRALLDCDARAAARLYGEHELLLRHDPIEGVARGLSSVRAGDGTLFQVLSDAPGRAMHERIVAGLLSPADGLAAIDRVAAIVARTRAAGIETIELRPEYILIGGDDGAVVTLLGPLAWRGDEAWRAPEEADGGAPGPAGDVYRLGLLVAVAVTGQAPPTMGADGQRKVPRLPPGEVRVAEILTKSLAVDAAARPSLETWRAALTAARGEAPRTDAALRRLGELALVRELGRGRLASVYEAVTASGERCAVKVLNAAAAADPELRRRFLHEARAVADIEHRGVIKVLSHGQDLDEHYVVMELAQGGSLADRLSASGPLDAAQASDLGRQVASAMQAVHTPRTDGRHLVHRDLKPSNILYRKAGGPEVAVSDFGIAKLYGEPTEHGVAATRSGRPLGTPAYMAPEQWMMLDDIDGRADVYALGAVLYESLTGRAPFTGRNDYELQQAHLTGEPPALADAGVPPRLAAIVHKMLARDRNERFASMGDVEAALASWPALARADELAAAEAARIAAEEAAAKEAAAKEAADREAARVAAEKAAAEKAAAEKAAAEKAAAEKAAAEKAAAEKAAAEQAAREREGRGRRRKAIAFAAIALAGTGIVVAVVVAGGGRTVNAPAGLDAPVALPTPTDAPAVAVPVDAAPDPRPRIRDQPRILNRAFAGILDVDAVGWLDDDKLMVDFVWGIPGGRPDQRTRLRHTINAATGVVLDAQRLDEIEPPADAAIVQRAWLGARRLDGMAHIPRSNRVGMSSAGINVFWTATYDKDLAGDAVSPTSIGSARAGIIARWHRSDEIAHALHRAAPFATPQDGITAAEADEIVFHLGDRNGPVLFTYRSSLSAADLRPAADAAGQQFIKGSVRLWWSPNNRRVAFVVTDDIGGAIVRGQLGAGATGP